MSNRTSQRAIPVHIVWSVIGLIIAVSIAFLSSASWLKTDEAPATEPSVAEVPTRIAPPTSPAPAAAPVSVPSVPDEEGEMVVPDTINGELVWPDPWDQIIPPKIKYYW